MAPPQTRFYPYHVRAERVKKAERLSRLKENRVSSDLFSMGLARWIDRVARGVNDLFGLSGWADRAPFGRVALIYLGGEALDSALAATEALVWGKPSNHPVLSLLASSVGLEVAFLLKVLVPAGALLLLGLSSRLASSSRQALLAAALVRSFISIGSWSLSLALPWSILVVLSWGVS